MWSAAESRSRFRARAAKGLVACGEDDPACHAEAPGGVEKGFGYGLFVVGVGTRIVLVA